MTVGKKQQGWTHGDGLWHRLDGYTPDGRAIWQTPSGAMVLCEPTGRPYRRKALREV